jgi:DNA polymerase III subunit delta
MRGVTPSQHAKRSNLALFWGEDEFLLRLAGLDLVEAHGIKATEIAASEWRGGETSDLATLSLWGERRALLVTNCQHLTEPAARELKAYLGAPVPEAVCVLIWVTRGRSAPALAKLVQAAGGAVRQVALRRQDVSKWVLDRARHRSVQLTPGGAAALLETVGEDPAALDQAVEQLAGAFAGASVGPAEVRMQFHGLGDQQIWDLCDRALSGRLPEALVVLRALLEARVDPLVILGGIASRLRDLIRVRALPDRMPADHAARAAGLRFDWQIKRYREQARRFSSEQLAGIQQRVVDTDRALKGGWPGDVLLPALVASMAGHAEAALDLPIRVSR